MKKKSHTVLADTPVAVLVAKIPPLPHGHVDATVGHRLLTLAQRPSITIGEMREATGLLARAVRLIERPSRPRPRPPTNGSPAAAVSVAA